VYDYVSKTSLQSSTLNKQLNHVNSCAAYFITNMSQFMAAGTSGPGGHLAVHHAGWDLNKEAACATTLNQRLEAITASAIILTTECALKCIAIVSVLCNICLS